VMRTGNSIVADATAVIIAGPWVETHVYHRSTATR
jgi:hypothetical protein